MKYKKVKMLDMDLSVIGFGCWQASGSESWTGHCESDMTEAVSFAIDSGINFFDTAPVYGLGESEIFLGKALTGKRSRVHIATKCGLPWKGKKVRNDVRKESILTEIDESLKRLNTDYVDLYQVHWPTSENIPLDETMEAMRIVKKSGKARHIGISNYSMKDTLEWCKSGLLSSYQGLYNIIERNASAYHGISLSYRTEDEIFPLVREYGLAFLPYSPLMQGLLTDRFSDELDLSRYDVRFSNDNFRNDKYKRILNIRDRIKKLFENDGYTMSQIALKLLTDKPEITSIIAGVKNKSQLEENIKSLDLRIDESIEKEINNIMSLL